MQRFSFAFILTVFAVGCGGNPGTAEVAPGMPNGGSGADGGGNSVADSGAAGDGGVTFIGDSGDMGDLSDAAVMQDAAGSDMDAAMLPPPGAPVVEILEPTPAEDPNKDEVIVSPSVTVRCRVTRATEPTANEVNQSKIKIQAFYGNSEKIEGVITAKPDNVFEAPFKLADVPNGPVQFKCSADDTSTPARTGYDVVDTFVDLGPSIEIIEPRNMQIYALKTPVLVKFNVSAAKLNDQDEEAAPQSVALSISGQPFPFTQDANDPDLYTASVNFNDEVQFPMSPVGSHIAVAASSSRTPDAPTRTVALDIDLDDQGPTISVKGLVNNQVVHGSITFTLTIADPAGVDPSTIVANINDKFVLTNWTATGNNTYTQRFDTRTLSADTSQITVNFNASDKVGNASLPVSILLNIDNLPPIVSLDPPLIREWITQGNKTICSNAFDPVGSDATSDGQIVPNSSLYRAMVQDRTNCSPGAVYCYLSDIDPSHVALYIQPNPAIPLLTDTDDDGTCDEINDGADLGDDAPVSLSLMPLTQRGTAYYASMPDTTNPLSAWPDYCNAGASLNPPQPLCPSTTMTRVIPEVVDGKPASIYASTPTNNSMGACAGNAWELVSIAGEGWHCLAARAQDHLGNVGVSPPIRVCVDDGDPSDGVPSCDPADIPDCLGGCAPPPDFAPNMTLHFP